MRRRWRWGQRGTGFTASDVYSADEHGDPKTLPPIKIEIVIEEPTVGNWDPDMVAALENIMPVLADGRNSVRLRTTCAWSAEKESFDPAWEFLDTAGVPMGGRSQRATNLTDFFSYVPLFWLGALRDAAAEFTPRSGHWGRLLRSVRIPNELEVDALRILAELDARIVAADPRLAQIAELIGRATRIAIGEAPGAARLNTLPLAMEDMLQRTGIVLRNEDLRPWLPLGQHGQGLQSLAVIFLFQAAVLQQLAESERPGAEAVFAIEEAEVHLHPQAARQLWEHVVQLSGQKLMTTHSPYFVQHIPLRDLRLLRLRNGCTESSSIPQYITSDLPWTQHLNGFVRGASTAKVFLRDPTTNRVAARSWISAQMARVLERCYRRDTDLAARRTSIQRLRHMCRILPSPDDEAELGFHGRRVRGEIFFARRWIMVEGVSEYLLIHALGRAFGWPVDAHGVSVIDFQQSGSAGIYPALATAFGIPWHMVVDGDPQSAVFRGQLLDRGFQDADLSGRFLTLPPPNDLEDQLIADGHEPLLRLILFEAGMSSARTCPLQEFKSQLKNKKTTYMGRLAFRVVADLALAERMPAAFVNLVRGLRDGTVT
jgi:putative ATP-dependent endonuclease of OLD family